MATTEYKLSYTAAEINERLGNVSQLSEDVGTIQTDVGALQTNVDTVQTNVGVLKTDIQNKAEIMTLTTDEYAALEETNANTLYMLTDAEEVDYVTESELESKGYLTEHQSLEGLATESYVDSKIAAIPTPDVSGQISTHNTDTSAHADIRAEITSVASELRNELLNGAGKNVEGNVYGVPADKTLSEGTEKTAGKGAEIFNCYEDDIENNVYANIAVGEYSHAEGTGTIALGHSSHAEGSASIAFDYHSHAEGMWTMALGEASHAEGCSTTASGVRAHAEGYTTIASGACAHAEGANTQATGNFSHVEGLYTEVHGECSHVQGKYNIIDEVEIDDNHATYAHIVGNGTAEDARSNAHTLDWSGNAWFAGDVYVGSTSGKNKDNGSKKLVTVDEMNAAIAAAIEAAFANIARAEEVGF